MPFAKLVIIQPGRASRKLIVDSNLVTIGRALDNVIALESASNVRVIALEIEASGDTVAIFDLDSRNGTTINDEPVKERQLKMAILSAYAGGSTLFEFHLSDIPWETREADEAPEQDNLVDAHR